MVMELNLPYMMMSCDMLMKLHLCASDDIYDNGIIPLICRWNYASHMIKKITPLISFDYTSDMIMELYLSYDVMCYGDGILPLVISATEKLPLPVVARVLQGCVALKWNHFQNRSVPKPNVPKLICAKTKCAKTKCAKASIPVNRRGNLRAKSSPRGA